MFRVFRVFRGLSILYCQRRLKFLCGLCTCLLLASWLAPAARGDGWPLWPFNKDDKPGKPDKIVALWNDTVLTQAGRPPLRGFGGRLMFYEGKKEDPIKVEGTLVVYAFDETDRAANNARPDRKYAFTPQQLPLHYSKSKIGHSYSVWLPWDEVGGLQKEITLIVRFLPKEGAPAIGEPARQLLPGRVPEPRAPLPAIGAFAPPGLMHGVGNWGNGTAGSPSLAGGVQAASYQSPVTEGAEAPPVPWQPRHITTTTIDVPSGSAIRTAMASPQAVPPAGYNEPRPGYNQPGPRPANPAPAIQNYPQQNYPPRGYPQNYYPQQNYQPQYPRQQNYPQQGNAPPPAATSTSPGLQLQEGFAPRRQWPLGEPLARLSRDRAPSQPYPAGSPSGPSSPPGQVSSNAAPAGPQGVPQSPN
jgi:hypothetical protein